MNLYSINVFIVSVFVLISGIWVIGSTQQSARPPSVASAPEAFSPAALTTTTLHFSTYLGGRASDTGSAITVDARGYLYVAGQTLSDDFPTHNAIMPYQGGTQVGTDVFVAKLSPDGDSLLYATYLGGTGDEVATALVVDPEGRIIVAGSTTSSDFPVTQPIQTYQGGPVLQSDAFIARLRADGSAVDFATYLGGTGEELITALALGPDGSLYAAGSTMSEDFPVTPGAFQETHAGGGLLRADAFITRLMPEGNGFQQTYATYFGGRIDEVPGALAVDATGRAYVTGFTNSPDFPTQNALQNAFAGPMRDGEGDVFLTRLAPEGNAIDFSTYLGRAEDDQGTGLVLQPDGTLYLTGWTRSDDFPTTPGAFQRTLRGTQDAFIVRLTPSRGGVELAYATFLGGLGDDAAYGLGVASDSTVWISGATDAAVFPLVRALQPVPGGGHTEAFVAALTAEGDSLALATYLGGSGDEGFARAAMAANDTFCVIGTTLSLDFPTYRAVQAEPRETGPEGSTFVSCFGEASMPVATDDAADVPDAFALHPNYPNPFNPTTTIPFTVARPGRVVLEIFDVIGRHVATLVDGTYAPGYYETPFDAHQLASGVYLYRIRMEDFQATRSLVLLR